MLVCMHIYSGSWEFWKNHVVIEDILSVYIINEQMHTYLFYFCFYHQMCKIQYFPQSFHWVASVFEDIILEMIQIICQWSCVCVVFMLVFFSVFSRATCTSLRWMLTRKQRAIMIQHWLWPVPEVTLSWLVFSWQRGLTLNTETKKVPFPKVIFTFFILHEKLKVCVTGECKASISGKKQLLEVGVFTDTLNVMNVMFCMTCLAWQQYLFCFTYS